MQTLCYHPSAITVHLTSLYGVGFAPHPVFFILGPSPFLLNKNSYCRKNEHGQRFSDIPGNFYSTSAGADKEKGMLPGTVSFNRILLWEGTTDWSPNPGDWETSHLLKRHPALRPYDITLWVTSECLAKEACKLIWQVVILTKEHVMGHPTLRVQWHHPFGLTSLHTWQDVGIDCQHHQITLVWDSNFSITTWPWTIMNEDNCDDHQNTLALWSWKVIQNTTEKSLVYGNRALWGALPHSPLRFKPSFLLLPPTPESHSPGEY